MRASFHFLLYTASLLGLVTCSNIDPDEIRAEKIDVRPLGKQITEEKDLEGYTCSFTYQAEGGTDEEWLMKLSVDETRTKFACSVERESGQSYLFFESFLMSVTGGNVIEGTVLGPQGKQLGAEEYKVDLQGNTVRSVEGKFQSQLDKVELVASKQKEEL